MAQTRRDFLRTAGCALGGAALASTFESFGLMDAYAQSSEGYRALVCVFLNGGNDGNNTVVSLDQYQSYANVRAAAGLALAQASLLPVSPARGGSFGFHPNMPEMRDLFAQGRLAVVCNAGPLVEPLTRATYQNGTGRRPLQLFSHSDQINLWQTSIANTASQTGWGGRTADRTAFLNGAASFPQVVSIAGIQTFVLGQSARPLAVSDSNSPLSNVLPLSTPPTAAGFTAAQNSARLDAYNQIRTHDSGHALVRASGDTVTSALETRNALLAAPSADFPKLPDTTLGRQLEQVAGAQHLCLRF